MDHQGRVPQEFKEGIIIEILEIRDSISIFKVVNDLLFLPYSFLHVFRLGRLNTKALVCKNSRHVFVYN